MIILISSCSGCGRTIVFGYFSNIIAGSFKRKEKDCEVRRKDDVKFFHRKILFKAFNLNERQNFKDPYILIFRLSDHTNKILSNRIKVFDPKFIQMIMNLFDSKNQ